MSALQQFLRGGGTIEDLFARYAIKATRHREFSNLILFKYSQIDSPLGDPIVQSARGPILDEADGWSFVSRPFDKFFNHGEGHAAQVDWTTARVQEKVDGSLCSLYWHAGRWRVSTSGMPDAGGEVNGTGISFETLFWQVWNEMGLPVPGPVWRGHTIMFELTTPYNRVVVRHAERRVVLLAVRDRESGEETPIEEFEDGVYPLVRSFPLQTMADVEATFQEMDPLAQEGYVIVDGAFHRVKVKHPGYVAIHHMRDGFGPKRILEVIRLGETTELLSHFPEWRPDFDALQVKFDALVGGIEADYERLKDIPEQKAFALEAVRTPCPAALFQMRKGQTPSARSFLAGMHIGRLMDLLHVRDTTTEET